MKNMHACTQVEEKKARVIVIVSQNNWIKPHAVEKKIERTPKVTIENERHLGPTLWHIFLVSSRSWRRLKKNYVRSLPTSSHRAAIFFYQANIFSHSSGRKLPEARFALHKLKIKKDAKPDSKQERVADLIDSDARWRVRFAFQIQRKDEQRWVERTSLVVVVGTRTEKRRKRELAHLASAAARTYLPVLQVSK